MIISHKHKFIFIKSWKTAGTSIEAALSEYCSGEDIVTPLGDYDFNRSGDGEWIHKSLNAGDFKQHDYAQTIKDKLPPEIWQTYFKFSIARNPWDRAVSFFFWEKRRDPSLTPRKRFYHYLGVPYDDFRQIKQQFSKYIKGEWLNNDGFYIIDDTLCVDFVIRYEQLSEDFREACRRIGVPAKELPHLKTGIRKQQRHYSEYFDEESMRIVAARHQNDIRLFGYKFERP